MADATSPTDTTSVDAAMALARQLGVDRLDAQVLLGELLARPRSWLLAHGDALLTPEQDVRLRAWLDRRAAGEPLAYLLGRKEFHGLTFQVSPAVLVPRPDTEVLVDWALEILKASPQPSPQVLDLGTGSGAIALAIRHAHPAARVTAIDASLEALQVAQANAHALGLEMRLLHSHWWRAVAGERFDLVVSNPPYIAEADPHLSALIHEPMQALTPGGDGLQSLRDIARDAHAHLAPGAWLLLEHGHDQASAVASLLHTHGLESVSTRFDLAGHGRCTGGRYPGTTPSQCP